MEIGKIVCERFPVEQIALLLVSHSPIISQLLTKGTFFLVSQSIRDKCYTIYFYRGCDIECTTVFKHSNNENRKKTEFSRLPLMTHMVYNASIPVYIYMHKLNLSSRLHDVRLNTHFEQVTHPPSLDTKTNKTCLTMLLLKDFCAQISHKKAVICAFSRDFMLFSFSYGRNWFFFFVANMNVDGGVESCRIRYNWCYVEPILLYDDFKIVRELFAIFIFAFHRGECHDTF